MVKHFLFLLVLTVFSCHKDSIPESDQTSYACGQIISFRLYNITSIPINYSKELDKYYIDMSHDSTKRIVGVFCDLPDAYKAPNKVISFNGSFSPIDSKDSTGLDNQLRTYFSQTEVLHTAIDKIN